MAVRESGTTPLFKLHYPRSCLDYNPRARLYGHRLIKYPDVLILRGSVLVYLIPKVIIIVVYALAIAVLNLEYGYKLSIPNSTLPSIAVVLGLVLVFKSNTSYAAYSDGRRIWSDLVANAGNLARFTALIEGGDGKEKMKAVCGLASLGYVVKSFLRDEELVLNCADNVALLPDCLAEYLKPGLQPHIPNEDTNELSRLVVGTPSMKARPTTAVLPFLLVSWLTKFFHQQVKLNSLPAGYLTPINNTLATILNGVENLHRISTNGIPLAYTIHLKHSLYIYCGILPFTLVSELGYKMVVIVGIVGFLLFGIVCIGEEVDNPFGYDVNDLPLDDLSNELQTRTFILSGEKDK